MEQESPLISIITVVFNAATDLEETIRNIAGLQYPRLNYIIIDGGSTDGTIEVIKRYPSVITKWISEADKGVYDGMNKGWKLASSNSYILFVGAGDKVLSLPEKLSPAYDEVIYGQVYKGSSIFKSVHNFKLKLGNTLHHQALLVPKRLHPDPPFDLSFKVYADFDFNQRLDKMGIPFRFAEQFKGYALPGGLSAIQNDTEMLNVVNKNHGFLMRVAARIFYFLQRVKSTFFFKQAEQ